MKKTAAAEHPIHEVIAERWSPRAFDPARPVGLADVETILEAARWAASAMNAQPWAFVYALRGEEGFTRSSTRSSPATIRGTRRRRASSSASPR